MDNEEFFKIIQTGNQAALLIGQIHGKIHNILSLEAPTTSSEVRRHLIDLFHYIGESAAQLYYKPELTNEKIEV